MIFCQKNIMTAIMLLSVTIPTYALQQLNDELLSETTGQDGITIRIEPAQDITTTIAWTDTNGINNTAGIDPTDHGFDVAHVAASASVVLGNGTVTDTFKISKGTTVVTIDADGGAATDSSQATLNINLDLPDDLIITTGNIYVAGKEQTDIDQMIAGNYQNKTKIINNMQISLGGMKMNIQLGQHPQGDFLKIYGKIDSGIQISPTNSGGMLGLIGARNLIGTEEYGIGMSNISIRDTGGADLTFGGTGINVSANGLHITASAGKQIDVRVQDFKFGNLAGSGNSIGNVALIGLDIGGQTLSIVGH